MSNFSRFNHIYADYGSLSVGANNKQVTTFSFDKTFKESPIVTVTVEHSSGWSDAFTLCITKDTTTNVTVSVYNNATVDASITLHVIAIGTI